MRICLNPGYRHRICTSLLATGLVLLLGGTESRLAFAQSETSRGTARVLVNSGDRPVEVPAPIQAPPRIAAPSPLPFDRRPVEQPPTAEGVDIADRSSEPGTVFETGQRTPIRREEGADTEPPQRTATPMGLGVLIIAGTLAAVLLLVRFGRQLRPGPPEIPIEALQPLGQHRLSPQLTLHLLQVGERVLLVGVGSDGVRTLTEFDDPAEIQQIVGYCRSGQNGAAATGRKPLLAWASKDRLRHDEPNVSSSSPGRPDWRERASMATAERETSDG